MRNEMVSNFKDERICMFIADNGKRFCPACEGRGCKTDALLDSLKSIQGDYAHVSFLVGNKNDGYSAWDTVYDLPEKRDDMLEVVEKNIDRVLGVSVSKMVDGVKDTKVWSYYYESWFYEDNEESIYNRKLENDPETHITPKNIVYFRDVMEGNNVCKECKNFCKGVSSRYDMCIKSGVFLDESVHTSMFGCPLFMKKDGL